MVRAYKRSQRWMDAIVCDGPYMNRLFVLPMEFPSRSSHSICIGCSPDAIQTKLALSSNRTSRVLNLELNFAGSVGFNQIATKEGMRMEKIEVRCTSLVAIS